MVQELTDRRRESPVWTRARLVGRSLHAAAFAVAGLACIVGAVAFIWATGRSRPLPNVWTWTSALIGVPGLFCLAVAIDEASRPLRRIGTRTLGRGMRRDGNPSWHPRIAGPVDEYRRTTQLNEAQSPTLFAALREAMSPRVRTRLEFDDAPFRRGAVARMSFTATAERHTIEGNRATFRLRCYAETPATILPWRGGIRCLADLAPLHRRNTHGSPFRSELEFGIPSAAPASDLAAAEPHYWVLSVEIGGLDGPYREEFFVPVA